MYLCFWKSISLYDPYFHLLLFYYSFYYSLYLLRIIYIFLTLYDSIERRRRLQLDRGVSQTIGVRWSEPDGVETQATPKKIKIQNRPKKQTTAGAATGDCARIRPAHRNLALLHVDARPARCLKKQTSLKHSAAAPGRKEFVLFVKKTLTTKDYAKTNISHS
jgi:hypothetical protein